MWEEGLIYVLIYLGVFFILPDKIRRQILSNPLLGMTAIAALALGLYGISAQKEGFAAATGCGAAGTTCEAQDIMKPYCLINERPLPTSDVDQTLIFNTLGRYIRVYAAGSSGDGTFSLSQVVVNNAAGTNIALNKSTMAVGTISGSAATSAVVDGTLTPRNWPSVWQNANTLGVANEYWQVDLGSVQMVTKVRVISRADYGETLGIAAGQPNRVQNVRVLVLQNTTDTPSALGVCTATPNLDSIYPVGTTAEEQEMIGPLILEGQNVQTALAIYRVLKQGAPSSLTQYGLTDSQSAEAYKTMRTSNLGAQRMAKTMDDSTYFSMLSDIKEATTMAAMPFDTAAELRAYLKANTKVKLNPVYDAAGLAKVDSAGKPITTSTSDGGVPAATNLIMGQTIPKRVDDTSNVYSSKTVRNADVNIQTPPGDTSTWSATLTSMLPVQQTPLPPPTGRGIIITPGMSDSDKAAALSTASKGEIPALTYSRQTMDSAGTNTSAARGFASPNATTAAGQAQWFQVGGYEYTTANAKDICALYGGKLATLAQVEDAQAAGASVCSAGIVADSTTTVYFPGQAGGCWGEGMKQQNMSDSAKWAVNCFGPKPAKGTPKVLPWTDVTNIKLGSVYSAGDWSRRRGGDGGASKLMDGVTPARPGTALKTSEVFFIGGSYTQADAQALCKKIGGDLATQAQLEAAQKGGAQWCSGGWVKDATSLKWPMQVGAAGCGGPGVNDWAGPTTGGANCYGIKPSAGQNIDGFTSEPSFFEFVKKFISQITEGFGPTVTPFSTNSTPSAWSQSTYVDTNNCPAGTTASQCVVDGAMVPTCKKPTDICINTCPAGQKIDPETKACRTDNSQLNGVFCPPNTVATACPAQNRCIKPGGSCDTNPTPVADPCPEGGSVQSCKPATLCVSAGGSCANAFPGVSGSLRANAPADINPYRFAVIAKKMMDNNNAMMRRVYSMTSARATYPNYPKFTNLESAIPYLSDADYAVADPNTRDQLCGDPDRPADPKCKFTCADGVTPPRYLNFYITNKSGQFIGDINRGLQTNGRLWGYHPKGDYQKGYSDAAPNDVGWDMGSYGQRWFCPAKEGQICAYHTDCANNVCNWEQSAGTEGWGGICNSGNNPNRGDFIVPPNLPNPIAIIQTNNFLARYVRVRPPQESGPDGHLHLSQIMVYGSESKNGTVSNVALNKTVLAAGGNYAGSAEPSVLTDGKVPWGPRAWGNGVWHTYYNQRSHNSAEVDLGKSMYISNVTILGRGDCCYYGVNNNQWDRFSKMRLELTYDKIPSGLTTPIYTSTLPADAPEFRYVRLQPAPPWQYSGDGALGISQIAIYNSEGVNVAKDGSVTSSPTDYDYADPQVVVDGNLTPRRYDSKGVWFSNVANANSVWIMVDLGMATKINRITIVGRGDDQFFGRANDRFTGIRIQVFN